MLQHKVSRTYLAFPVANGSAIFTMSSHVQFLFSHLQQHNNKQNCLRHILIWLCLSSMTLGLQIQVLPVLLFSA